MNIPLLHTLRDARGAFVPLASLEGDPATLRRDLEELEAFGFALERHPYQGVAYRGPAERLCPDQIEWSLETRRIGRRIAVWDRVRSTNDLAARAAVSRANDGLVILAEEQTAGRGRRGRKWNASRCTSLLMSLLVFPPSSLADPSWLTALGAVAVAEVVAAWSGRPARIKWPNDVRVDGRKIAGILVERSQGAVIGIGLNVNTTCEDFPDDLRETAISLRGLLNEPADRSELARALIRSLDDLYGEGIAAGAAPLAARWKALLEGMGASVALETTSGSVRGLLRDAELGRGLLIESDDGRRRVAASEIVSVRLDDNPAPI